MSEPSDNPPLAHTLLSLRARTARDLMTPSPICVFETDPIDAAAELLARYSAVPVVDLDRHCIGVISRTDLARVLGLKRSVQVGALALESRDDEAPQSGLEYRPPALRVADAMTRHVYTVDAHALATEVLRVLRDKPVGRVFVVDAEMHLIGVVSTTDFIARLSPVD